MKSGAGSKPNILFLIADALRLDFAKDHAATLMELAGDNLWFENAVTPAPWSLPAHASIFTGQYPHEHGKFEKAASGQPNDPSRLIDRLNNDGYSTYGVSANGFASVWREFDRPFDEFHDTGTRVVYPLAMNVPQYLKQLRREDPELSTTKTTLLALRKVLADKGRAKSLVNLLSAGVGKTMNRVEWLHAIPHPFFQPYTLYNYSAEKNSTVLKEILEREADSSEPFFIFANYMDTHRPFQPPATHQRELLGEVLPFREVRRLNEDVAPAWEYLELEATGKVERDDVEVIRRLYAGEVSRLDDHLRQLRTRLDRLDLLEDTLVVITADHGENLGNQDPLGGTRMGHEASMSEDLLRVPLLISHPEIDGRRVTEPVSLKELFSVFTGGYEKLIASEGTDLSTITPGKDYVVSEYPAAGGLTELDERHPNVSDGLKREHASEHLVAAYSRETTVIASTSGLRLAWHEGEEIDVEDAPEYLGEATETHLQRLEQRTDHTAELTSQDVANLEALGYL